MLQNIQTAVTMAEAAAKEAAEATKDLQALISWAERTQVALMERDKEMVESLQKSSTHIQTELEELRTRASSLLDKLTGNGKPEEKPGEAEAQPPEALALPAALDRRNNGEEANGNEA